MIESQKSTTHLSLYNQPSPTKEKSDSKRSIKDCQAEVKCSICGNFMYRCFTVSPCMHNFCSLCLSDYLSRSYFRATCPICRGNIQCFNKNILLNQLIDWLSDYSNSELQVSEKDKEIMIQRENFLKGFQIKKYEHDGTYFGTFKNNKREGKGKFMDNDQNEYDGEWKNDKMEGKGEMKYSFGGKYSGEWKNNKKHGFGAYVSSHGSQYRGEWQNGMKYGFGEFQWANGAQYKGDFKDDRREGQGECSYANGDKYKGEWKNDKQDGLGEFRDINGEFYRGEFKENQREGQGECSYANGDKYKGEWKDGKKHGLGEFRRADGRKEIGEWRDDEFYFPTQQQVEIQKKTDTERYHGVKRKRRGRRMRFCQSYHSVYPLFK